MSTATHLNDPAAHVALREAHDAGYRFPEDFAGFSAKITAVIDGHSASGRMTIRSPRELELEIDLDEEEQSWLRREIVSIAGHRWHLPYEEADGRHTLSFDDDPGHALGRRVTVHDDRFDSWYRVDENGISQVNRGMGTTRFSIQIQERTAAADGRLLPAHFTVLLWDLEQERMTGSNIYRDRFVDVDGIQLPAERRVIQGRDEGISVRQFALSEHQVLTTEA